MKRVDVGGILAPAGFRAGSAACGIKTTPGKLDVALVLSDAPAAAAGTFTTNKFAAAPVHWSRGILPSDSIRAVVINAGNANACTGDQGRRDTEETAALVAELVGCRPEAVCVASTGIIGHPMPMPKLRRGVCSAFEALHANDGAAANAALAIMTTDTVPKVCAVEAETPAGTFRVAGMAKGSGMIAPNMATMLAVVTTDAAIDAATLDAATRRLTERTFNRVTVDGDCSTNDSLFVLANGAAGVGIPAQGPLHASFCAALEEVLADLCRKIARDGEGATRLVEVTVSGATAEADAVRAARAVGDSLLFKCAVAGGDPNWGRIVCALGYSGADVRPSDTTVHIGGICVMRAGTPTEEDATAAMREAEVRVEIDLGRGEHEATVLGCDLTHGYVTINADYHT